MVWSCGARGWWRGEAAEARLKGPWRAFWQACKGLLWTAPELSVPTPPSSKRRLGS